MVKLRITFLILTLSKGGGQRMLVEIINGLAERGYHVSVVMPMVGTIEYELKAPVIRVQHPNMITVNDCPVSDFIISCCALYAPIAAQASINGKGIHIRFSLFYEPIHAPNSNELFPGYFLTTHVLSISTWHQKLIELLHGIKSHLVPIGISKDFKNHNSRQPKSTLNISTVFRGYGDVTYWHHDQEYLVNQLIFIHNHFPNVQVNFFTPPNEFNNSPIVHSFKSHHPWINFLTPQNDIELCHYYNNTDIFVSSSYFDAGSLPGLEAMQCGAALVTTCSGGNMDYCRHEENCLVSHRYNADLANNIIRLIQDPNLRQKIATAGQMEAKKWTWDQSVRRFEEAILKIRN